MANAAFTTLVFVAVFALIYRGAVDRRNAVLTGAAAILLYGLAADFFTLQMALDAIYFETLSLIFGMSVISAVLARSGLFALIANRAAVLAMGNGWWILVLFSLMTYGFSLLVNNLAAMVVILPVTLAVCWEMGLNPLPILIAEIVASNLGGASTMIGDFPNMIISSAGHLHFLDFIGGMMVPCLILLAAMLWYFQSKRAAIFVGMKAWPGKSASSGGPARGPEPVIDRRLMKQGLTILGAVLASFLISDAADLRPGWIALLGGIAAVAVGWKSDEDWFAVCGGSDILFFAGLFVMVGGIAAAGVLDGFVWLMEKVSGGQELPLMLALMWIAAVSTIFLNAGAATAFFIPVANNMNAAISDPAVWWALSLGVLAGSSAALTGATAGPLTASHLDRFIEAHPEMRTLMPAGVKLDFKEYLNWGLPIMGIFLGLSSLYIAIIAK